MTNPQETTPRTLYGAAISGITLAEALDRLDGGCALLTAPSAYKVATVSGRDCLTKAGPVDLSAVYEARAFTPDAELRWVEAGYAVLLTENKNLLPGSSWEPLEPIEAIDTIDTRYLVWGKVKEADAAWATLASSRVGTLNVPRSAPPAVPQDRVRLITREYVTVDRDHGNANVAEERLLRFEPYRLEGAA
ncbi:type III-D CRISPR-associated protein Csx19 [Acrocarpospora catenulata]|uniref:type III-D CRISPR-associated protein Csx19 n=1 Tax=Acrocarpospora catenulata TaxID=2836182 RepID=UPI001BDA4FBB|nr:CRISPR-associated protein Csx19 [Acrocarpospora catenulata]